MRARTLLAWIAVGLVGLALAAGVTYAATQLSSQRIGLSAEPPSAGEELAPAAARTGPRTTPAAPSQTTTAPGGASPGEPADDSRGSRTTGPSEEHGEGARGGGSSSAGGGGGDLDD